MRLSISMGPGRRLAVASGVAFLTGLVVVALFEMDDQSDSAPVKTVTVLVAKAYVAAQSPLDANCCYERRVPETYAPPRAVLKKELGVPGGRIRFRARGEILKGEIVTSSRVIDADAGVSAGWDMAENETAVTVHLTPEGAMAGILSPGDNVNMLAAFASRACVLVPRARVMAVGKRSGDSGTSDETLVTLAVSPKDAMRILLATQKTTLSLALVAPTGGSAPSKCVELSDL